MNGVRVNGYRNHMPSIIFDETETEMEKNDNDFILVAVDYWVNYTPKGIILDNSHFKLFPKPGRHSSIRNKYVARGIQLLSHYANCTLVDETNSSPCSIAIHDVY